MTQTTTAGAPAGAGAGLVRVTVVGGGRRVDLALPGAVPVAELVPELSRTMGVLDPQTTYAGYSLRGTDGRELDGEAGLAFQGVEDGALLSLVIGAEQEPPKVYDDIIEAMADAVEAQTRPWDPASARRTGLGAGVLLLALGAAALGLQRPDVVAGAAAGVGAAVLLAAAIVLSRVRREQEAAVTLAWCAVGYAAIAGLTAAPAGPLLELPLALAGLGALAAGTLAAAGLQEGRTALLPAIVVGAVVAASSGLATASGLDARHVLCGALVLVVLGGSALPWAAIAATATRVEQAHTTADLTAEPQPVDAQRVWRDAVAGHEVLLAITTTVGVLTVLVASVAVGLGVAGTLLVVMAAVVLMLRTRQYRVDSEVGAGLVLGVAGIAATVVAVLVQHDGWRPVLAVVLAVTAAALLLAALVPSSPSVRRGRLGDLAELVALLALPTLLVLATGLVGAVRG